METEDAFLIGDYSFFDKHLIKFYEHPKNHHLLGSLKNDDLVQRLIRVTENKYTLIEKEGDLYLNDLRFGMISVKQDDHKYAFSYKIEQTVSGIEITEEVKDREDAKKMLSDLWNRLWGRV